MVDIKRHFAASLAASMLFAVHPTMAQPTSTASSQLPAKTSKPNYRALNIVQEKTVVFASQQMFDYENLSMETARLEKSFPNAMVIPLPEQNAGQFIIDKLAAITKTSPYPLKIVIHGHGAPNTISTYPLGYVKNEAWLDTHDLLDDFIKLQAQLGHQLSDQIIFESCDVLANSTRASRDDYQKQAAKLNAIIIGSTRISDVSRDGRIDGNYFAISPDGGIIPYDKYAIKESYERDFRNDDNLRADLPESQIDCYVQPNPQGCLNQFSALDADKVIGAANILYTGEIPAQAKNAIAVIMDNPDILPPKSQAAAYLLTAKNTDVPELAQKAMEGWSRNIMKLPQDERHDIAASVRAYNLTYPPANNSIVMGAITQLWLATASPPAPAKPPNKNVALAP